LLLPVSFLRFSFCYSLLLLMLIISPDWGKS
jgi:hypothetical protein